MTALALRNIVWPITPRLNPNGVQRLARVLHWCFVGGAAVCLAFGLRGSVYDLRDFALGAAALAAFGRALRYVMAGE